MVAGSGGLVRAMLEPCVLSVSAIVATDCARGKLREPTMFDNVVYICVLMSFSRRRVEVTRRRTQLGVQSRRTNQLESMMTSSIVQLGLSEM
jgi:hypothetical protein